MYAEVVMVSFNRVPHYSPLIGYFRTMGGCTKIQASNAYSVIPLLDTQADAIASIATLVKQKQRKIKDIARGGVKQALKFYDPATNCYPKADIAHLAEHMINEGIRDAKYMSSHFLSFFEKLYEARSIKVLVSYEDNTPVASFSCCMTHTVTSSLSGYCSTSTAATTCNLWYIYWA